MEKKGYLGLMITFIIGTVFIIFMFSYLSLVHYGYFAPKFKEVEREVWEATPSRIEGATQEINRRYLEYQKADDDEKTAICGYLRNSYPDITENEIDDYRLRQFFLNCKYGDK